MDSLRDDWRALTDLADHVQHQLLSEQRLLFEREVDKQVKAFVVKTIQFRNSFDTEGPLVPGLIPSEAAVRLGEECVPVWVCGLFVPEVSLFWVSLCINTSSAILFLVIPCSVIIACASDESVSHA